MRKFILIVTLIISSCSLVNWENQGIPERLHGDWQSDCQDQDDVLGIRITKSQILFWETIGDVISVTKISIDTYEIKLELFSEGDTWIASMTYELVGNRIVQLATEETREIVRYKCA